MNASLLLCPGSVWSVADRERSAGELPLIHDPGHQWRGTWPNVLISGHHELEDHLEQEVMPVV